MKNIALTCIVLTGILVLPELAVSAAAQSYGNLGINARRHVEHSAFDALPFGKRDHSLGISYEFHENLAFWQIGLMYAPDLTPKAGADTAPDYAITPELNLVFKDGAYLGGVGVASTYIASDESEWSSMYWQFLLGLGFDLSRRVSMSVYGYYPFRRWGDLNEFGFKDIEFGLRIGRSF